MLPVTGNAPYGQERLRSRSARALVDPFPVGLHELGSGAGLAEGYLYVPAGYQGETPTPLVLLLHGAGEDARDGLAQLRGQADEAGIVLLASSSRGPTWGSILARGRYGAAVAAIDRALGHAFARCKVDPARVALAGYSDRASYALSLGLANGDLFSHVLAFSPGFLAPTPSYRPRATESLEDGHAPQKSVAPSPSVRRSTSHDASARGHLSSHS